MLNSISVRITQRKIVNDERRTSNLNNLIYPRSDPSPVNPIHQSRHFVPSIILGNVMSLSPRIDEIRLYVQDHFPDIICFTEAWLKDSVENSAILITKLYPCQERQNICTTWGFMLVYKILNTFHSSTEIGKRYINRGSMVQVMSQTTSPQVLLCNSGGSIPPTDS